jgi:2-(1,2-epoxy-1,2-dihydrophenyl)acetyl-CoA isomerase
MQSLLIDTPVPNVRSIFLNRPHARNAIDATIRRLLLEALDSADADEDVRVVLLGGVDGMFCAGGDLQSMSGLGAAAARQRIQEGGAIVNRLWRYPKPVVVALQRFAVGAGAGLALLADDVVMGEDAIISFPFLKLGLVADWGLMKTLPWRVGNVTACRLLSSAAVVAAKEALHLGLVSRAVAADTVIEHAIATSAALAKLPSRAFARMKAGLRSDDISAILEAECEAQVACLAGDEFAEGYAALREKRIPDFLSL